MILNLLKFLLKIQDKFPIICRDNPGFLEEFVTQQMLEDNSNSVEDRLSLIEKLNLENNANVDAGNAISRMQDDLETFSECLEYVPVAVRLNRKEVITSPDFHKKLNELVLNDIDEVSTEDDLGSVEDDIDKLADLIPSWDYDFESSIEEKRDEILQHDKEENDDWENSYYYGQIKEEEKRINEMFTSLRAR